MRTGRILVMATLFAICAGVFGRMVYLGGHYYACAPRLPDPASGAVVPVWVHHGTKVFLTQRQWLWFQSPAAEAVEGLTFVFSLGAAGFLGRRWRLLKNAEQ